MSHFFTTKVRYHWRPPRRCCRRCDIYRTRTFGHGNNKKRPGGHPSRIKPSRESVDDPNLDGCVWVLCHHLQEEEGRLIGYSFTFFFASSLEIFTGNTHINTNSDAGEQGNLPLALIFIVLKVCMRKQRLGI